MKSEHFENRIQFIEFAKQGPEPSLRRLIFDYYKTNFGDAQAQIYTDRYIAQMCAETNK